MDGEDRIFQIVAIERTLFVEGRSRDRKVGEFRGLVLAIGWWSDPGEQSRRAWGEVPPPALAYLVSDRQKPAPVWVGQAEITVQEWITGLATNGLVDPAGAAEREPDRPG